MKKCFMAVLLIINISYLFGGNFDDAIKEGWPLKKIQKGNYSMEQFILPIDKILGNFVSLNDPSDIILGDKPYLVSSITKFLKEDGKTIRRVKNENIYYYKDRTLQYFDTDAVNNIIETEFDNYGRIIMTKTKAGNYGTSIQTYVYDLGNSYMFKYKNNELISIVSEEFMNGKLIYNEYGDKELRQKIELTINKDKKIIGTTSIIYLPNDSSKSELKFEYCSGKLIRAEYYSFAVDKLINSINYFYNGNKLIKMMDLTQNEEVHYSNFDENGNWLKKETLYNGIITSFVERTINFGIERPEVSKN